MGKLWQKLSLTQFKIISIIGLFAGDIAFCTYAFLNLKRFFNSPLYAQSMQQAAKMIAENPSFKDAAAFDFSDPAFLAAIIAAVTSFMKTAVIIILCCQALAYLLYYFRYTHKFIIISTLIPYLLTLQCHFYILYIFIYLFLYISLLFTLLFLYLHNNVSRETLLCVHFYQIHFIPIG